MTDKVEKFNVARLGLEFSKHFSRRAQDFLFEGLDRKGTTTGDYMRLASVYPTGEMREFIGDAVVHDLKAASLDILLAPYEHTVGIPRHVLRRGDAITQADFSSAVLELASSPWANVEKELTDVLINNPVDITGATFFNDNGTPGAKVVPGTGIEITNDITVAVSTTIAQANIIEAVWRGRATLLKMRNSINARVNEVGDGARYVVMYAPNLEQVVQDAFATGGGVVNDKARLDRLFSFRANPYLPDLALTADQFIYVFVRGDRFGALGWGETHEPTFLSEIGMPSATGVMDNNMWKAQVYADRAFGPASPFSVVRVKLDVT
jgi:hypothetical protein